MTVGKNRKLRYYSQEKTQRRLSDCWATRMFRWRCGTRRRLMTASEVAVETMPQTLKQPLTRVAVNT